MSNNQAVNPAYEEVPAKAACPFEIGGTVQLNSEGAYGTVESTRSTVDGWDIQVRADLIHDPRWMGSRMLKPVVHSSPVTAQYVAQNWGVYDEAGEKWLSDWRGTKTQAEGLAGLSVYSAVGTPRCDVGGLLC